MFDFEKTSASKFYAADKVERVVEFSPPDVDMQNIAKILSLAVDAKCGAVEAFDGYAQVSGRTNFRLAYLDRDGAPKGVDYNADFTVKAEGDFAADDSVSATITVVETDVEASDVLKLSAVLEVATFAIRREEFSVLVDAENCYETKKELILPTYIASKNTVSPFDAEGDAGGEVQSVLSLSAECIVKSARAKEGGALTAATVVATVTYLEGDEIKQRDFSVDVEEELSIEGVEESDFVHVTAGIKNAKIVLQGVTDDNVIRVEGEAQFKVQIFRCAKKEVVDDVFDLSHEIAVSREKKSYLCFDGCGSFSERVNGVAVLGDNRPAAIDVKALPYARLNTSRATVGEDGALAIEGVVNTDVIYADENGFNSVRAEIPFSIAVTSETPFSQEIEAICRVEDISARVRKEREIDIDMTLAIAVCGFSPVEVEYIAAVEQGEEKEQNTSGISLYIARGGDTLLDLCKAFTAMPDAIAEQNPSLQFPLAEGERAIYFRQIK